MAKILIADDSTVCRTVLAILLTNQGHDVVQANDGKEALAQLDRAAFDLVLLDHEMPQAYGVSVLRRVRERSLDLRPAMLDGLGLLAALLWHFERYTYQTRIQVRFHHFGLDRRFPAELETAAYRIIQEALTNTARYAHTDEVDVHVRAPRSTRMPPVPSWTRETPPAAISISR